MTDASTAPRAGRREWLGLAVLALPCLVYAMDLTVLNLAVPKLSEDLQPSSAQLLWIVDIYGFLVAGLLVTVAHAPLQCIDAFASLCLTDQFESGEERIRY